MNNLKHLNYLQASKIKVINNISLLPTRWNFFFERTCPTVLRTREECSHKISLNFEARKKEKNLFSRTHTISTKYIFSLSFFLSVSSISFFLVVLTALFCWCFETNDNVCSVWCIQNNLLYSKCKYLHVCG